jgi:hypothetical protein
MLVQQESSGPCSRMPRNCNIRLLPRADAFFYDPKPNQPEVTR